MTASKSGTRDRIVTASAALFMRQGYPGTGLKQISTEAEATFGSLYHFFPGGKEELAAESLRVAGEGYRRIVEAVFDAAPDIVTGTYYVFLGAGQTLLQTAFVDACPIATVASEVASKNEALRAVTEEIFDGWIEVGTERFRRAGVPDEIARELFVFALAALEGAFILSRASKSVEPMRNAGRFVADAVRRALTDGAPEPLP